MPSFDLYSCQGLDECLTASPNGRSSFPPRWSSFGCCAVEAGKHMSLERKARPAKRQADRGTPGLVPGPEVHFLQEHQSGSVQYM